MYGVESARLEPRDDGSYRLTREEILDYYDGVCEMLHSKFNFHFACATSIDLDTLEEYGADDDESDDADHRQYKLSDGRSILARKIVDARYLQPDLPIHVPPKFRYDPKVIRCFPVNALAEAFNQNNAMHYVVIGGGKTGMDAITYLIKRQGVDPDNIVWVVPNEVWITAWENIGSCLEFLHECARSLLNEEEECARWILCMRVNL